MSGRIGGVYFIQANDDGELAAMFGPVKIGCAGNIRARLRELQTGNPDRLILLGWIDAISRESMSSQERFLHRMFATERIRGEWFCCSERILRFIETKSRNLLSHQVDDMMRLDRDPSYRMPPGRFETDEESA